VLPSYIPSPGARKDNFLWLPAAACLPPALLHFSAAPALNAASLWSAKTSHRAHCIYAPRSFSADGSRSSRDASSLPTPAARAQARGSAAPQSSEHLPDSPAASRIPPRYRPMPLAHPQRFLVTGNCGFQILRRLGCRRQSLIVAGNLSESAPHTRVWISSPFSRFARAVSCSARAERHWPRSIRQSAVSGCTSLCAFPGGRTRLLQRGFRLLRAPASSHRASQAAIALHQNCRIHLVSMLLDIERLLKHSLSRSQVSLTGVDTAQRIQTLGQLCARFSFSGPIAVPAPIRRSRASLQASSASIAPSPEPKGFAHVFRGAEDDFSVRQLLARSTFRPWRISRFEKTQSLPSVGVCPFKPLMKIRHGMA